jgi:hypothetical protein
VTGYAASASGARSAPPETGEDYPQHISADTPANSAAARRRLARR